jgi:hypothetical protein
MQQYVDRIWFQLRLACNHQLGTILAMLLMIQDGLRKTHSSWIE